MLPRLAKQPSCDAKRGGLFAREARPRRSGARTRSGAARCSRRRAAGNNVAFFASTRQLIAAGPPALEAGRGLGVPVGRSHCALHHGDRLPNAEEVKALTHQLRPVPTSFCRTPPPLPTPPSARRERTCRWRRTRPSPRRQFSVTFSFIFWFPS